MSLSGGRHRRAGIDDVTTLRADRDAIVDAAPAEATFPASGAGRCHQRGQAGYPPEHPPSCRRDIGPQPILNGICAS